jgi:predicted ATPase
VDLTQPKLQSISADRILSFGEMSLPLQSLNVLVGPNGSGKSNLIELIALLRSTAGDFNTVIRQGGGWREWVHKGNGSPFDPVRLRAEMLLSRTKTHLRHTVELAGVESAFAVRGEVLENPIPNPGQQQSYFFYKFENGRPMIGVRNETGRELQRETVTTDRSIVAQRRDPDTYPELTAVAEFYETIRIFREWSFGRNTVFRVPQPADGRSDRLEEDFSNLGLVLNRLCRNPIAKASILGQLQRLYEGFENIDVAVEGGTVQVVFQERGQSIPATRLSDGTLRFLCLLAILCDPSPAPIVCIEEPELGLHPDVLPGLADLMVEASTRCQLIVTTHSDILIDALSETPDSVVICERRDGATVLRRLVKEDLTIWLEKYRLGQLWTRGDLGGVRW